MRRTAFAALSAVLVLATAVPALAHPTELLDPTMPTDVTFAATDNVEYLGRFPEHTGTAGGRLFGDVFFLTDPRGVYAYNVSYPAAPVLLGSLRLFQTGTGAALAQEDPDTDGRILLVDAATEPHGSADLQVIDVSDPADLKVIGTADVTDHTWNCVTGTYDDGTTGCAYAYGRTGHIVDLTDPTTPTALEQTWRAAVGYGDRSNSPYAHDLTEIRPGLVMSAGETNILMDTSDPAAPIELTRVFQLGRFADTPYGYHSVEWANGGTDPIAVFGTEIAPSGETNAAGSDCDGSTDAGSNSVVETWDAAAVIEALDAYEAGTMTAEQVRQVEFELIGAFDAGDRGIFLDGQAPGHVLYCAHWMELHPDFDGGGKMVVSYYDRGTRFVDIAPDGTMEEIGWITAAEGYSGSAQWITDEIVYIMDYRRGMEVVQLTGEEATGTYTNGGIDIVAAGSSIGPVDGEGGLPVPAMVALALGLTLLAVGARRRRLAPSTA